MSASGFAQVEQDIVRPSINADQFCIGAKAETALNKGQLSVNIPLVELKGKGYNLPISLAFYGGDVTFSTEASPVGLGWALMAGGVITKTIKGSDDTANDIINRDHHYNDSFLQLGFPTNHESEMDRILNDVQLDPMPDEYIYSLPGHSGTIDVSRNENTVTKTLYPDESYVIEEVEGGLCITADDGTKFYFEEKEGSLGDRVTGFESTSWFLSRIVTTKGGTFTFNYAKEEYVDLTSEDDVHHYRKYRTNRITSIVSDYGLVTFHSVPRSDRGSYGNHQIAADYESKRINKIELRDENGNFIKGYELDNSGWFTHYYAPEAMSWTEIRHKLSSITQYDSIGNYLPPYEFEYSYNFMRSKLVGPNSNDDVSPKDSWTSSIGTQAFANLDSAGNPTSLLTLPGTVQPDLGGDYSGPNANDYFCITRINYPTGATDEFVYEEHNYGRINTTRASSRDVTIQGRRLASKIRHGNEITQQTDYIYNLHDSFYNTTSSSSGVLTNPCFHRVTYYTLGNPDGNSTYAASKMASERAFNSYMGTPVFYTEVEEVEKNMDGSILSRNIHYFEPKKVNPPTNYFYVRSNTNYVPSSFVEINNRIFGELHCYNGNPAYFNGVNMTYLAYPVSEFCIDTELGEQPLKEVFIGEDGRVRSIKQYNYIHYGTLTKFGYKIDKEDTPDPNYPYIIYRISKSEYKTRRYRPCNTQTTYYFYNGEQCDSICEGSSVNYSKGRVSATGFDRDGDNRTTFYYFPDEITDLTANSTSTEINAINKMIEKNIIAIPIKTITERNNITVGGECTDYQLHADVPLPKTIYKLKNTNRISRYTPEINGNNIDYRADIYKDGEILTYDENLNPEHIRSNAIQDRIYVWGYDGRFPIAIIDNLDYDSFNSNNTLKSMLHGLEQYRRIETAQECTSLRSANAAIRLMLPETTHITTFTYDPYFGITSELNDSNFGTICTYDSFGRLSAKYDAEYNKLEEFNYHFNQQQ